MRDAMAHAPVGDDVYGNDPTVNTLEAEVAALLGTEAAVYMPSGTMSNQVAIRAHTEAGDAIFVDQSAHVYLSEAGAPAAYAGVLPRLLPGVRGIFTPEDLRTAVGESHPFNPTTLRPPAKLLCLENTHNAGGGSVWPIDQIVAVTATARQLGLRLHLDGARIWNASLAAGVPESEYARHFDSISVCFSKGLGAPVGSALCGSTEFVARARRFKQQIGGGFRQAGIIAAGALYALRHHRVRLDVDHANARALAEGIHRFRGISLDPATVETNIVRFRVTELPAGEFVNRLHAKGVHALPSGADGVRAITYLDITTDHIREAIAIIGAITR
jgi:threonine aldolase